MVFPVSIILDSYTLTGIEEIWKRRLIGNLTRTMYLMLTAAIALVVYNKMPYLNAIAGAIACCPVGYTLPALFHWKLGLAKTKYEKVRDISMVALSFLATCFTTEEVIRTWSQTVVLECN